MRKWNLRRDDWVLTGEYAWGLQGYKFKPRKGHLDILVDRRKLSWKIKKSDASTIPPKDSLKFQQLREFINKTKFGPHLLPLPIGKVKWQTLGRMKRQSQLYTLPNKRKIRIHKVSKLVEDRANILLEIGIHTWDKLKIKRWLEDFAYFKKFAEKKKDRKVAEICGRALKRCEGIRKRTGKLKKEEVRPGTFLIKGSIVYKGKVRGRARVIYNAQELSKFQKGNILIAPMTTPDFIIAIEKAKGIITDQGGVGCHAAIISREFKIPCIIGTKNATKVFKDGDLVELNAYDGIARKLKK